MNARTCLLALLVGLVLAGSLGANLAAASGAPSIDRWVVAGGGGSTVVGGTSLYGIAGQPMIGGEQSDGIRLWHGFLGGGGEPGRRHSIYLPLIPSDASP